MYKINFPLIKRQFRRLAAGKFISMDALAEERLTLHPEEQVRIPSALYLPDDLDNILGLSPWRTWQQENQLISGAVATLAPSVAYRIRHVDLVGAWLYCGAAKDQPGFGPEKLVYQTSGRRKHFSKANLVTSVGGSHFFGAMLLDDFVLELNSADPENNIRMTSKYYGQEADYRRLLGIDHSPLVTCAHIDLLTTFAEPSNNSSRAARYRTLRGRLRNKMANMLPVNHQPRIYLKRGSTGEQRILENEAAIENFLVQNGFDIVEPSQLSVDEIVGRTMNAALVVSVEGSHLSHVQYTMADDATLLVLQPPDRFSTVYKEFTDCLEMKFAFLVGKRSPDGFTIPLDALKRMLNKVI